MSSFSLHWMFVTNERGTVPVPLWRQGKLPKKCLIIVVTRRWSQKFSNSLPLLHIVFSRSDTRMWYMTKHLKTNFPVAFLYNLVGDRENPVIFRPGIKGSHGYMAPEILAEEARWSATNWNASIFSIGCLKSPARTRSFVNICLTNDDIIPKLSNSCWKPLETLFGN